MPKSIRPGAMPFNVANAFAVTAAMRFDGTSTPVPRRIREVLSAAAAIATKQSPVIICVSKNQAWVKPSSSARCASFHESLAGRDADPEIHFCPLYPSAALRERAVEKPRILWGRHRRQSCRAPRPGRRSRNGRRPARQSCAQRNRPASARSETFPTALPGRRCRLRGHRSAENACCSYPPWHSSSGDASKNALRLTIGEQPSSFSVI